MILLTRTVKDNNRFQQKLDNVGLKSIAFPCIKIVSTQLDKSEKETLHSIDQLDWILFTSSNAVIHLIEQLYNHTIPLQSLLKIKIAAVGSETAKTIKSAGLSVDFIPSEFTDKKLEEELPDIYGKKIFIPRSKNANQTLPKLLAKKGGIVTTLSIYSTGYYPPYNKHFSDLLQKGISRITFTSGSCVLGFMKKVTDGSLREKAFALPVVSIGPSTTKIAKENGFRDIITAKTHTVDGMIDTLK